MDMNSWATLGRLAGEAKAELEATEPKAREEIDACEGEKPAPSGELRNLTLRNEGGGSVQIRGFMPAWSWHWDPFTPQANYTVTVTRANNTVTIVANPEKESATVEYLKNGTVIADENAGESGFQVSLWATENPIDIRVTSTVAGITKVKTHTLTVKRKGGSALQTAPTPLTARFENAPGSHDGSSSFTVDIVFSEAPVGRNNQQIRNALTVTGGSDTAMSKVAGDAAHRRVTIEPDGNGPVGLSIVPTLDCADANALCTADGGRFESPIALNIPGPGTQPTLRIRPLTAEFTNVPEEHDGSTRFHVDIVFSERPAGLNNKGIRAAMRVDGGRKRQMKRVFGTRRRLDTRGSAERRLPVQRIRMACMRLDVTHPSATRNRGARAGHPPRCVHSSERTSLRAVLAGAS